jgi:nitric oxide reductase large subunit
MKLLFHTANFYMILGLVSGLYYRELTHLTDFEGETRLSVVHTHLLALGMLFFLIALALEKVFALSESRLFKWFYWIYNTGLIMTVAVLTLRGTLTVLDNDPTGAADSALAGIAGIGHVVLTLGLILFFHAIEKRIKAEKTEDAAAETEPVTA